MMVDGFIEFILYAVCFAIILAATTFAAAVFAMIWNGMILL